MVITLILYFSWKCVGEQLIALYDKATKSDPIIVSVFLVFDAISS